MTSSRIRAGSSAPHRRNALRAVRRDDDLVALLLERVAQQALDVRVVVDDEDLGGHPDLTPSAGTARRAPGREEY